MHPRRISRPLVSALALVLWTAVAAAQLPTDEALEKLSGDQSDIAIGSLISDGPEAAGEPLVQLFVSGPDVSAWRAVEVLEGWAAAAKRRDKGVQGVAKQLADALGTGALPAERRTAAWLGLAALGTFAADAVEDLVDQGLAESGLTARLASASALAVAGKGIHKDLKAAIKKGPVLPAMQAILVLGVQGEDGKPAKSALKSIIDERDEFRSHVLAASAGASWRAMGDERSADKALEKRADKLGTRSWRSRSVNWGALVMGSVSFAKSMQTQAGILAEEDLDEMDVPGDLECDGFACNHGNYMQWFCGHLTARAIEQASRAAGQHPESLEAWSKDLARLELLDQFVAEILGS
jgi:hypothetical protein